MMVHFGLGRAEACHKRGGHWWMGNLHCGRPGRRQTHHDAEKNGYHASSRRRDRRDDSSRLPLRTLEPPEEAGFLEDSCLER